MSALRASQDRTGGRIPDGGGACEHRPPWPSALIPTVTHTLPIMAAQTIQPACRLCPATPPMGTSPDTADHRSGSPLRCAPRNHKAEV